MAKKISAKNRRKASLTVISPQGRQPFMRGVVTHELMQRGLEFDDAYAVAHAVKGRLTDRHEVSSEELWDLILELTETSLGADAARRVSLVAAAAPPAGIVVSRGDQVQPFSRGLLARSLSGAGLDFDRSYRHVMTLEGELRAEGVDQLDSGDLALRVAELLQRVEGKEAANRYRMVRRVHHLPKPIAIYIGGASGTGKSTLALDLAPMLRIYRVIATDTIRQVMRMVFSPQILPVIHGSSFAASQLPFYDEDDDPSHALLNAFQEQAVRVGVGVRAVVERAVAEGQSILVEGVHLLPPVVPFPDLDSSCYQVPLMLATPDAETHRRRFFARTRQGQRVAERYIESFESIRVLHDFMLEQAESEDIPLISTTSAGACPRAYLMCRPRFVVFLPCSWSSTAWRIARCVPSAVVLPWRLRTRRIWIVWPPKDRWVWRIRWLLAWCPIPPPVAWPYSDNRRPLSRGGRWRPWVPD